MKSVKLVMSLLFSVAIIFACGVGIAADKADKAEKAEKADKTEKATDEGAGDEGGGKTEKKGPPKGTVLYEAQFEEEDDTDAWSSDGNEIEWQKGGANGSKGCLKIGNAGDTGVLVGEKYIQWYDAKTYLDCDYNITGFNEELYFMAWGAKAGQNVRSYIKGFVKGKWSHAQAKAAALQWQGKSGRGDTFRNILFCAGGQDKDAKDPTLLVDNFVITATDKKKEEAE